MFVLALLGYEYFTAFSVFNVSTYLVPVLFSVACAVQRFADVVAVDLFNSKTLLGAATGQAMKVTFCNLALEEKE